MVPFRQTRGCWVMRPDRGWVGRWGEHPKQPENEGLLECGVGELVVVVVVGSFCAGACLLAPASPCAQVERFGRRAASWSSTSSASTSCRFETRVAVAAVPGLFAPTLGLPHGSAGEDRLASRSRGVEGELVVAKGPSGDREAASWGEGGARSRRRGRQEEAPVVGVQNPVPESGVFLLSGGGGARLGRESRGF